MANSSAVTANVDTATAAQYNNLRLDVLSLTTGHLHNGVDGRAPADNEKAVFGTGLDATIYYDGTNLVIDPKEVGSGFLDLNGDLNIDGDIDFQGPQEISTSSGDLSLNPVGKVTVTAQATAMTERIRIPATNGDLRVITGGNINLADDATSSLVTGIDAPDECGLLFIRNHTDSSGAIFSYAGGAVTILQNDAAGNWDDADTDTKDCVFVTGGALTLKNRKGGTKDYRATVLHQS